MKEEIKLSLFADDVIIYIENLKELTKKLPTLISNYNKFAGYKVNVQQLTTSLYTSNKQVEFEIKILLILFSTQQK